MRLGLFGGTFDPIHLGHLILAEACRESLGLDRILFVVAGRPPHKPMGRTSVADRLEMVRIATAGHSGFEVSEVESAPDGPRYSFETLEAIGAERPGDELFFLIGADSLADLPGWRRPDRVAELATIVVVNRENLPPPPEIGERLPPELADLPARLRHVSIPTIGISSTDLRRRVAEGRSIRYQVSRGVEAYIAERGLYPI